MCDPEAAFLTCLSPDEHENNIKDHILHYLGCVEISKRNEFLKTPLDVQSDEEIPPTAATSQPEENQQKCVIIKQKEAAWRESCQSELRRIAFLRSKLEKDEKEKHLVENIVKSRKAWKASEAFKFGIEEVKNWRKKPHIPLEEREVKGEAYEPGQDVNTPFMMFKKQTDASSVYKGDDEEVALENAVWGKFPNQKTNVQRLLFNEDKINLLNGRGVDERIKYFHIPSNNMLWAEQAVSKYYGDCRPNFHPLQRDIKEGNMSKAAWILKESHWRGQLHGGRATISSRYMRPFCESIRSLDDVTQTPSADTVAQNIVLFMPYMHWETSRNQQRFSQIIENIVDTEKKRDRRTQLDARKQRQQERNILSRPKLPEPADCRSCWVRIRKYSRDLFKDNTASSPDDGRASNANDDRKSQLRFGPIRSMTQLLRAQAVKEKLQLSGHYPQVDQYGRVDLDAWLEEQRDSQRKRSWFHKSQTQTLEPRYRLGQYLLDAALLFEAMTSYRDRKLLETYLMKDPPMHPRRTLDQAYYWSINNTNHRDLDQVVYRATTTDPLKFHRWDVDRAIWTGHNHEESKKRKLQDLEHQPCSECTSNIQKVSRIIMVDQLWMWVLDKKTIITCFPKRYGANKHDTSGIHKSIRMRIEEGGIHIRSVFDLALVIFEECSNTFFDRTRTTDKQPQVLDEFSEAIGNIMHQQTDAFEKLWRWTERASKMYRRLPGAGALSQLQIPLLDIKPEGKLEKEIKDIVEELGIMTYIKKAEKDVLESFVDNARQILKPVGTEELQNGPQIPKNAGLDERLVSQKGWESRAGILSLAKGSKSLPRPKEDEEARAARAAYEWFCNNSQELLKRVEQRIAQLEELERSAKSTAEMVKDLLELKQQQAGVVQAWQSVEYSNEAMRQGRSILVFTIVTIVFLPLSFMSSVFGMNAIELGGSDNVMRLRDQFTYIFSISAGVIILTLLFSISTSFRTFLWCIFRQSYTTVLVWTGVYRHMYLKLNLSTDDMYENAVKKTENLKAKEKEKFLTFRREHREKKEKKKRNTADTQEDASKKKFGAWRGLARSLFGQELARGSANGPNQDSFGERGATRV